ncbi:MAG: hypothetical protein HXX13_13265 [Bacteroidetes bacterium]|nr:hypothetical protein [Bacteroidota bacterium]
MKKILLLVQVIGLTLLMACNSGNQGNGAGKNGGPYGIKSGIVTYKPMNMMGMTISQTIYFDDFGNKETREIITQGSMMGQTVQSHAFDIREGLTSIHYELENIRNGQNTATKEAFKQEIPKELLEQQYFSSLSDELKKKMKYKEDGTETVAGLTGTKYSMAPDSANPSMVATGVHYKNILLKLEMAGISIVAEKVDFDAKIPAEKFKVPEGYTVIDKKAAAPAQGDGQMKK